MEAVILRKRVLILGSTGMLGHVIYNVLQNQSNIELFDMSFRTKLTKKSIICDVAKVDTLEKQIMTLQGKLNLVTQKLENEKNRVVKPEANPETGEVPLRTGLANAILDKKIDTKKLVQTKKKDEIKVGGKTKIDINPDKDIGQYSGGMRTNNGNLH